MLEEGYAAPRQHALNRAVRVAQHPGLDHDVRPLPSEQFAGLIQRLSALQLLEHIGIAGLGHFAGDPFPADKQGIPIQPRGSLFALRQPESVLDKPARVRIELAQGDGVLAAVGQANQAKRLGGFKAICALVDPVGVFS